MSAALPDLGTPLWASTMAPPAARPHLEEDVRVDVAVVGAGIVGVTTALLAAGRGLDVALLEARRVGAGTTGATTGKFSAQNGLRYHRLRGRFGREAASAYAMAARAGIDRTADLVSQHRITCGFERTHSHLAVTTEALVSTLEAEAAAATDAGLRPFWGWGGSSDLPIRARAVLTFRNEYQLHPLAYLAGLVEAFVDAGGSVYEHSPVVDLRRAPDGVGWHLDAAGCRVRAEHIVVATRLPVVADRRLIFARATPVGASAIAGTIGSPLPSANALVMGESTWSIRASRWPESTQHLVVVGPDVVWKNGPRTADAVERWAAASWPDLDVTHRWFAQDQQPIDDRPLIGRIRDGSVWTATGFGKWGLALGTYASERIVAGILGDKNPLGGFFEPRRIPGRRSLASLVTANAGVAGRWISGRLPGGPDGSATLRPGEGRVRRQGGRPIAEARDLDGTLHTLDARCTHLGCPVSWNQVSGTWDCRCHGARFAVDGAVLEAPATEPLTPVDPWTRGGGDAGDGQR